MELTLRQNTAVVLPLFSILKVALLFLILFFAFPLVTSLAEEPVSAPTPLAPTEQALLQRINEVRSSYGLAPLYLNMRLAQAAESHSWDMHQRRWGSHWGSDGSSYGQRIARTGYVATQKNEAIGWGYNMDRMITWWLNSPVHRPILLSGNYQEIGLGYAGDRGNYWVLNFGTHR